MKLEKYCNNCKFYEEEKCTKQENPTIEKGVFVCWLPSFSYSIELIKLLGPNERDEYLFSDIYDEVHLLRKIETGSFEEKEED
ncbi:hypothetical protein [Clostridium sp. JNZ J1-5]